MKKLVAPLLVHTPLLGQAQPSMSHGGERAIWMITLCACTLALLAAPAATRPDPAQELPKRQMTKEEKVLSWNGERVILRKRPTAALFLETPKDTGTISEVVLKGKYDTGYPRCNFVVTLEGTGERIEFEGFHSVMALGFFSEKEAAKRLIGVSFWAKGSLLLYEHSDKAGSGIFSVRNTEKVTVSGVEWGRTKPVALCFRTDTGREGCWLHDPLNCFDNRFSFYDDCVDPENPSSLYGLYSEDPHELFPGWSKAIWELIERSEIAIGMTEKMAEVACGGGLEREGSVLSPGDVVSPIYKCGGKRFIVVNGKVSKYVVEPR